MVLTRVFFIHHLLKVYLLTNETSRQLTTALISATFMVFPGVLNLLAVYFTLSLSMRDARFALYVYHNARAIAGDEPFVVWQNHHPLLVHDRL